MAFFIVLSLGTSLFSLPWVSSVSDLAIFWPVIRPSTGEPSIFSSSPELGSFTSFFDLTVSGGSAASPLVEQTFFPLVSPDFLEGLSSAAAFMH